MPTCRYGDPLPTTRVLVFEAKAATQRLQVPIRQGVAGVGPTIGVREPGTKKAASPGKPPLFQTGAGQDQRRSTRESGIWRTRLPVAAKIALQMAGATGGKAGSPSPVVGNLVERKCVSMLIGESVIRISG